MCASSALLRRQPPGQALEGMGFPEGLVHGGICAAPALFAKGARSICLGTGLAP